MFWISCYGSVPLKAAIYIITYNIKIIDYQQIEPLFPDPFGALIEPLPIMENYVAVIAAEFDVSTSFEQNGNESRFLAPFGNLGAASFIRMDNRSHLPDANLTIAHVPAYIDKNISLFQFDFKATLKKHGFLLKLIGNNKTGLQLKSYKPSQQPIGSIQLIWNEPAQSLLQQPPVEKHIYVNNKILNYAVSIERHKKLVMP